MKLLFVLMMFASTAYAESGILAVWEETPNGLVRVDNQHYVHQPQQNQQPRYDVEYHPGLMSPDFIHRPKYRVVNAYMLDCKCVRPVNVRVN